MQCCPQLILTRVPWICACSKKSKCCLSHLSFPAFTSNSLTKLAKMCGPFTHAASHGFCSPQPKQKPCIVMCIFHFKVQIRLLTSKAMIKTQWLTNSPLKVLPLFSLHQFSRESFYFSGEHCILWGPRKPFLYLPWRKEDNYPLSVSKEKKERGMGDKFPIY